MGIGARGRFGSFNRGDLRGVFVLMAAVSVAALVVGTGTVDAQQAGSYNGVQPRTPVVQIPAGGEMRNFTLVGQNPLIDPQMGIPRSMNGGIAAKDNCVYIGSNIGMQPDLVVDVSDPTNPTVVGPVPGWIQGKGNGIESLETVPDLNLLAVSIRVSMSQNGILEGYDPPPADANVGMLVYDVSDCRNPKVVGRWDVPNGQIAHLHYMDLWRDPKNPSRVLANVSFDSGTPDDGIDLRIVDLTGCPSNCNPTQVAEWGLSKQLEIPPSLDIPYDGGDFKPSTQTHDSTWTLDGTRMYLSQTNFGFMMLDTTALGNGQPCDGSSPTSADGTGHCMTLLNTNVDNRLPPFGNQVATVHGIVKIPGRPYVSLQHEGHSCPYGGIDFAYVGTQEGFAPGGPGTGLFRGDLFPRLVGTFGIPENNVDRCPKPGEALLATSTPQKLGLDLLRNTKTVHNVLAFPHVEFATWYGGALRAIDTTDINSPFEAGYFFNKPAPAVVWCQEQTAVVKSCDDPVIGPDGRPTNDPQLTPPEPMARSYPLVVNGYIMYSDEAMGLYILKYTGPHADEIPTSGLCISHNPNVVSPGFEPCPPYSTQ